MDDDTPPPQVPGSSDEEEDLDLPTFGIRKAQKLQTPSPPSAPPESALNLPAPAHAISPPPALAPVPVLGSARAPRQQQQKHEAVHPRSKTSRPPHKLSSFSSSSSHRKLPLTYLEELKSLSPFKVPGERDKINVKENDRKVKKISKRLKEKTELEKKVSCTKLCEAIEEFTPFIASLLSSIPTFTLLVPVRGAQRFEGDSRHCQGRGS